MSEPVVSEPVVIDATDPGDPLAAVAACRAGGGAERDPVRFHVIEALARRAAAQQGLARQLLVQRVDQMVLQLMQQPPVAAAAGPPAPSAGLLALGGLVDRLGRTPGSVVAAAAAPAPRGSAAPASRLRTAVREVEDTLVQLQSTADRSNDARVASEGFAASLAAAQARYNGGLASLFELEDARRSAVQAQSALIELQRERVAAWIALYRALGGGWSTDAAPAP